MQTIMRSKLNTADSSNTGLGIVETSDDECIGHTKAFGTYIMMIMMMPCYLLVIISIF